jgi:hypothetical protein
MVTMLSDYLLTGLLSLTFFVTILSLTFFVVWVLVMPSTVCGSTLQRRQSMKLDA